MGVREIINRRKPLFTGLLAGVIIITLSYSLYYAISGGAAPEGSLKRAWYTVDDGKTWFADSADKLPPFEHEGKTAYRCYVFTCDGGATKFVGFMERYTPEGKKKREEMLERARTDPRFDINSESVAMEIKAPLTGDKGWVSDRSGAAAKVVSFSCPGGGDRRSLTPVRPPD